LGNGGEYYGSCKQVLSQSNVSTSDFKSTSTKVSSSQPSANNSSDDSSKGDPSQGKVWASENNGVGKHQPTDKTNLKNISIVEKCRNPDSRIWANSQVTHYVAAKTCEIIN
jgi:hypothetical protein